jgi:hypothetical protein
VRAPIDSTRRPRRDRKKGGGNSNTPKEHKVIYASSTRTLACELVTLTPRTRAFSRMVTRLRAETVDAISAAKLRGVWSSFEFGFEKSSFKKGEVKRVSLENSQTDVFMREDEEKTRALTPWSS